MIAIELTFLVITYTFLILAIFLEVVCYKRNMENWETIAFTGSLLLLVISISISPLFEETDSGETSSISTLLTMILVSVTTFLNTLAERQHSIKPSIKVIYLCVACILTIATIISYFSTHLVVMQTLIVSFLVCTIVASMLIIRTTKPQKIFAHLERTNRIFALTFMALVPLYLIFHYGFEKEYQHLQIGFILPIGFTLLAGNKIYDDLQRLSILKNSEEPQKRQVKNYGLTEREEEIALLLSSGISYQGIAEQLFIALPTVKTHASNIYKKCGVKSRHELSILLSS